MKKKPIIQAVRGMRTMDGAGVRLTRVEPHVPSLEDLYFAVRHQHLDGSRVLADDGGRRLAPERIGRP